MVAPAPAALPPLPPPVTVTWPRLATCPITTCGVPEVDEGEEEVRGTTPRLEEGLGVGG